MQVKNLHNIFWLAYNVNGLTMLHTYNSIFLIDSRAEQNDGNVIIT